MNDYHRAIHGSIKLIDFQVGTSPDGCHSNPITEQGIPDCGGLRPFHEHLVVGLEELHLLHEDVVFPEIVHFRTVSDTRPGV